MYMYLINHIQLETFCLYLFQLQVSEFNHQSQNTVDKVLFQNLIKRYQIAVFCHTKVFSIRMLYQYLLNRYRNFIPVSIQVFGGSLLEIVVSMRLFRCGGCFKRDVTRGLFQRDCFYGGCSNTFVLMWLLYGVCFIATVVLRSFQGPEKGFKANDARGLFPGDCFTGVVSTLFFSL